MKHPLSFEENLSRLSSAFSVGFHTDMTDLRNKLLEMKSVIVVGSGASFSTAVLLTRIIEGYFEIPARCKTPYEFTQSKIKEGVILISASGANNDILSAANHALTIVPDLLVVITARQQSAILDKCEGYPGLISVVVNYEQPHEREGFLGSQSVIALAGAFLKLVSIVSEGIEDPFDWCENSGKRAKQWIQENAVLLELIAKGKHLVCVHTIWASACAIDFESKFVEGGVGNMEIAEAKNFTHGRFVNSITNRDETTIVFLATPSDNALVRLFETNIAQLVRFCPIVSPFDGVLAGIDLFILVFYLFNHIAKLRGVNVSSPDVPDESRIMFNGNEIYQFLDIEDGLRKKVDLITEIKNSLFLNGNPYYEQRPTPVVKAVVRACLNELYSSQYGGLICDYDGTLVPIDNKDLVPSSVIAENFVRLLKSDIPIAIVTGRGKSVMNILKLIIPSFLWNKVFCYLYNGAVCWNLSESAPLFVTKLQDIDEVLRFINEMEELLSGIHNVEVASLGCQITINPTSYDLTDEIMFVLSNAVLGKFSHLKIASSGRSIDIFPIEVGKVKANTNFRNNVIGNYWVKILKIGDRGDDGGNDCEFLKLSHAFSVDKVNWIPTTGFPVIDSSGRVLAGVTATEYLLDNLMIKNKLFTINQ